MAGTQDSSTPSKPPDQRVRDRIRDELGKNFLVEAAAGTGKTTNIIDRMVSLIASGTCRIDQLAAVTFTRKAGAELRERFQARLLSCWSALANVTDPDQQLVRIRLQAANDGWNQAFVGTIHSFCTTLLRERPIEFGVAPDFREMDEEDERLIRNQAWFDNIQELLATGDPLITQMQDLGIERGKLRDCLNKFIEFRDISDWPCTPPAPCNIEELKQRTREYIDHMRTLIPDFKPHNERGRDQLMGRYEAIVRASKRDWNRDSVFFALLERFDISLVEVQNKWHNKAIAKIERDRWKDFRESHVRPGMDYWCNRRYRFLIDFLRRAVGVYSKAKRNHGGLDFQDLLITANNGLRTQPELRSYFQSRFPHLLVDEFQDTDPIQAEMMLYLTSSNVHEQDWNKCKPRPGALFLVGDPKQSIYRFRRGDMVTYNRVKQIFAATGGEVLALVTNFRSHEDLIAWNNGVYLSKFAGTATDYSPAAEDMLPGLTTAIEPAVDKKVAGLYRLELPNALKIDEVREIEANSIAAWIRHAVDSALEVARSDREAARGMSPSIQYRDVLIIPRIKKSISLITQALEQQGIPYEVAGGNPLQTNAMLASLIQCLRVIDDPYHAIHYLGLLRDFFGFSDQELFLYKEAGGVLSFTSKPPEKLTTTTKERFQSVMERLSRYQVWMRTLPYVSAVERIAEDLGLFASAAACSEGNVQAGGLFKAIERLRYQNWNFDSATDMIEYLEEVLSAEESDGCTALAPDANVVRVMNLHKAKGLEAPIVFLADVSQRGNYAPNAHIDRRGMHPRGYVGISEDKGDNRKGQRLIACPKDWEQLQLEEKKFLDAEDHRLMYVATTRASRAMIISVGKSNCHWSGLYDHLDSAPAVKIPNENELASSRAMAVNRTCVASQAQANTTSNRAVVSIEDATQAREFHQTSVARWQAVREPSYEVVTAKNVGLRGKRRPKWEASGDYGHLWGSAVHELLEVRHKLPQADLRSTALRTIAEFRLGNHRLEELLATVDSVVHSQIWKRAQQSELCYSELPIEILVTSDANQHTLVRGVIDLIFREPQGWIIIDYKTDDIAPHDVQEAVGYYHNQLEQYAKHWINITGEPVTELGLYFTRIDHYAKAN